MSWVAVAWALLASASVAQASLVLNEVLYDPAGPDTDAEFVEIFNPADQPRALAGCRLVFLNGTDPQSPSVVWEAAASDGLEAKSFFVVGGELVTPRQATARLALQNGPDALQLWQDDTLLDALAWGDLQGVGEGNPAVDVASASLGRIPDGADTNDNAADWFELITPNPGAANAPPHRFALTLSRVQPPWNLRAGPFTLSLRAWADGSDAYQQATVRWLLDGAFVREDVLAAARGDTLSWQASVELGLGPHAISIVPAQGLVDSLHVALHVGLASVVLSEILARPSPGEPEWIELRCLDDIEWDLGNWALADAARVPRRLPEQARIGAGGFALVSQDCLSLSLPEGTPCWELQGGWIALNNTASDGGWADEVLLLDAADTVLDWAPYDEHLQPATGVSMERSVLDGGATAVWFASPGDPTPGRPNLTAGAVVPDDGLKVSPVPFSPDGDGQEDVLHVVLRTSSSAPAWAEVFDLTGDPVCALGERGGPGVLQWIWDGRDARGRPVPMGAYVVVVRSSARPSPWRSLVALGRRS